MEGSGRKCLDDARRILGRVSRCARDALQPHTSVATIAVCLLVYSPPLVNSTEPSMSKVFCYDINFIKVGGRLLTSDGRLIFGFDRDICRSA